MHEAYTCTLVVTTDLTNVAVVTATPPTGPNVTANDSAVVDVLPKITVTKTANPTQVLFTGGSVTFTFVVKNDSSEPVTITALSDSVFGSLTGSSTCQVGTVLPVGESCSFTLTRTISGAPGTTHRNVFTATAVDNENNPATSTDDATVYFFWRGRTPGYWKNHPSEWKVFTPATTVKSVFNIPSTSTYTCITSSHTLLTALGYGGGSTTCNATQILLRAAVAAILNEQFFGTGYPLYDSPQKIIDAVNAAIATRNRTTILNLATQLDYWNNGVH